MHSAVMGEWVKLKCMVIRVLDLITVCTVQPRQPVYRLQSVNPRPTWTSLLSVCTIPHLYQGGERVRQYTAEHTLHIQSGSNNNTHTLHYELYLILSYERTIWVRILWVREESPGIPMERALSLLLLFVPPARLYMPAIRPVLNTRHTARHAAITATSAASPLTLVADLDTAVITDTLLDIGVYTILFGVAALTIYSLVVTLQKSNEEYGGWTPRDDEDISQLSSQERLRPGARYDPVTEQWMYPAPAEKQGPQVGRADAVNTAASAGADSATNRYDRRMAKKRKRKK